MAASATAPAKERISIDIDDWNAAKGTQATATRVPEARRWAGGKPGRANSTFPVAITTISIVACMAAASPAMTSVLTNAIRVAPIGLVMRVFQLLSRCSGRHTREARIATPSTRGNNPWKPTVRSQSVFQPSSRPRPEKSVLMIPVPVTTRGSPMTTRSGWDRRNLSNSANSGDGEDEFVSRAVEVLAIMLDLLRI